MAGLEHAGADVGKSERTASRRGQAVSITALSLAALIVAWAIMTLIMDQVRFAVLAPRAEASVEAASALARLFGAGVLLALPPERGMRRLRWAGYGLGVLGVGELVFGYLQPLVMGPLPLNASIYVWLVVQTVSSALFAIGLAPSVPPAPTRLRLALIAACAVVLSVVVVAGVDLLPRLALPESMEAALALSDSPNQWLTTWHWVLSAVPLALTTIASVGAVRHNRVGEGWLAVALVFLAGAQLHNAFWPSAYSPVLATADLLRLAFALVVTFGGVLELRAIARRASEHSRRMDELAVLKADFTAMVAHELGSPLAAIRGLARCLATGRMSAEEEAQAVDAILAQTEMLMTLVADVRSAAVTEREDFDVHPCSTPLRPVLEEAVALGRGLPGDHPIICGCSTVERVWADPQRLRQVLENLLINAAKYSPAGAPIEIRVVPLGRRVRVEIADQGVGIPPEDIDRIFEKFSRGNGSEAGGLGLGLYLSQRVLRAHGSELTVASTPGSGAVFAFELEVVR